MAGATASGWLPTRPPAGSRSRRPRPAERGAGSLPATRSRRRRTARCRSSAHRGGAAPAVPAARWCGRAARLARIADRSVSAARGDRRAVRGRTMPLPAPAGGGRPADARRHRPAVRSEDCQRSAAGAGRHHRADRDMVTDQRIDPRRDQRGSRRGDQTDPDRTSCRRYAASGPSFPLGVVGRPIGGVEHRHAPSLMTPATLPG